MFELPAPMPWFISLCRVTLKPAAAKKRQVAGASQVHAAARAGGRSAVSAARENNCRLSFAEGRRGVQECNCFSHGFKSFIIFSFQGIPHFLQAITISARCRVR